MKIVQPHHLLHRGVVQATGLFFDTGLISDAEAMTRILALWEPGAVVYRLKRGLMLRLPASRQVRCDESPGLPLVSSNGLLLGAPLTPGEMRDLNAPANALILVCGGRATVYDLANAVQEDPATWLELTDWRVLRPSSLGRPPAPPRRVAESAPFDPHARMKGVPPVAPERAFVIEALRKAAQTQRSQGSGAAGNAGVQRASWLQRLIAKVVPDSGKQRQIAATGQKAEQGFRFTDALNRLLMASGLAKAIGRRHAEYIGRMMEMFERGDLHEALRHAIAMGELEGETKPPALFLTPRKDLTVSAQRATAGSSISLGLGLLEHLKELYRQAFRKLEAESRIEEAAFVLAELLGANEEAVAFLERHKRLRLAAEMAEARNLPPGLVVRLWFLAGEEQRAILIARRYGAFADAILRLERTGNDQAQRLRILWAISLATAGDYAGAVDVVKPVMQAVWQIDAMRRHIETWLNAAIASGGPVAARMLARKIALLPGDEVREQALALLEDESVEMAASRSAFAVALGQGEMSPLETTLARAAARSVLRDADSSPSRMDQSVWKRLIALTDDAALRADMVSVSMPESGLRGHETPVKICIAAADIGTIPLYDAAYLPDGRCLVALGEMGVRLLTRDGRTVTRVEQPAYRLVLSDHGNQVILLAPRGDVWRMARMNLNTRRAERWRDVTLRAFAPGYDGSLWFVADDKDFLALDVTSDGFDALWRLPNLEGNIQSIARSRTHCSFLLFSAGVTDTWGRRTDLWTRLEQWTHSLPDLFLRERNEVAGPLPTEIEGRDYAQTLTPEGGIYSLNSKPVVSAPGDAPKDDPVVLWSIELIDANKISTLIARTPDQPYLFPPYVSDRWTVVSTRQLSGIDCRVLDRNTKTLQAEIAFERAETISVRITASYLTIADDRGRLVVYDLDRGELLRDLRIHG